MKPVTVGQFEFVEWTPENHLRYTNPKADEWAERIAAQKRSGM
jgi:hypothetical protein